ncbi:protein phosphatase [Streptococcus loxodontisalivarius]|uniref:Protein phosphatase n=2 Tax=Streptococcus loxodontisalivarius TaxID=1349415 RepID=A0ABS2PQM9_9STRE|nr:protein phosphatase [Streptococcus loxodontisalivarius]
MSENTKTMEISLLTDIGQKRSNNQDFVNKYDNKVGIPLIVLADGMGGHRAGNIASEMAVTNLGREWVNTDFSHLSQIRDWMMAHIEQENQKIYELGQTEDYKGMGTTIEALAVVDNNVIFAHVGDSRIGFIHEGNYTQLTSDHSLVNELVKAGQLTEEEAAVHPQKNIITQSIGQANPVELDLGVQPLEAGDTVLINSDGLTNMVSKEEIEAIITDSYLTLSEKAKTLVDTANNAGGLDNITVALVRFDQEDN